MSYNIDNYLDPKLNGKLDLVHGLYLVRSLAETVNDVLLGLVAQDKVSRCRNPEVQHEQN